MKTTREKRAMMNRTISEACLVAGSQVKKPAAPKKWYRSLSFAVRKKSVGNLEIVDKTECESDHSAASEKHSHSPEVNAPDTTTTKTLDCSSLRSSNSRADNQQCSRKPETRLLEPNNPYENGNAIDPGMCLTPKNKKASLSSIQPRRSISHRDICISPTTKSRTLPQRQRSSSLQHDDRRRHIDLTHGWSFAFSEKDSVASGIRKLVGASDVSDSGSIPLSVIDSSICVSPKKSPTKQSALTPKKSIRYLFPNTKKMNPLQEIPLSPSLWDAADFCQTSQTETCSTKCPSMPKPTHDSHPSEHSNTVGPEICFTPKSKKASLSSKIQPRRSISHREICVSPVAKSRTLPQRTRSSSLQHSSSGTIDIDQAHRSLLEFSKEDSVARKSEHNLAMLYSPTQSRQDKKNAMRNTSDPEIRFTPKTKKASLSSKLQPRRSISHREICVSAPDTKLRTKPQRTRSSSLDFAEQKSVVRKPVYNPETLYSPTTSRQARKSAMNPTPSIRSLVEASDFSESASIPLSVFNSSICVSQFSPKKSPTKQSALTPFKSVRSLFSNGKKMCPLQEIPLSPSLWDAADFCQTSPAVTSATKFQPKPNVALLTMSCPRSSLSISTELMAVALTDGIRRATKIQKMQENRLNERILNHMSFAHGRLSNGSTRGALLSMKKAKRVELERDRVRAAIACLEKHLSELNGAQSTIAALPFIGIDSEDKVVTKSNPCDNGAVDIAAHKQYAFEVEQILSASEEKVIFPDDEALLEELMNFTLEERADKCLEELRIIFSGRDKRW